VATSYRNAQVQGGANVTTYSTLFNTSESSTAVISSIVVVNTSTSDQTYRVAIMDTAGTPGSPNWLVFDAVITGKDTVALTLGVTLGTDQFIRVSSSNESVLFHAFISEII
jgi:hypothetical protein